MKTIAPGIVQFKRFLDHEKCKEIVELAERDIHWVKAYVGHYQDDQLIGRRLDLEARDVEVGQLPHDLNIYLSGYSQSISSAIAQNYSIPNLKVEDFMFSKYMPGCHIKAHSDTGVYSTSRVVTAVQYLNEDYDGGNLFFPDMGVSIRPERGDLILFWSEYNHGVNVISKGVRYCVVSFGKAQSVFKLHGT